jgi:hypothetical protein
MSGPVENDIDFATREATDAIRILGLGLVNAGLKQQAEVMWKKWDLFLRASKSPREFVKMSDEYQTFLTVIIERQNLEWLGWLPPLWIEHTRRENDLFTGNVKQALGQVEASAMLTPAAEFKAWIRNEHDHALTLRQLLDPTEGKRIELAQNLANQFGGLYNQATSVTPPLVLGAEQATEALDAFVVALNVGLGKAPPESAKSVIPPLIVEHVLREGRRFLNVLHRLKTPGQPALV